MCDAIHASHAMANAERSSKVSETEKEARVVCLACSYIVNVIGHDSLIAHGESDTHPHPAHPALTQRPQLAGRGNIATFTILIGLSSAP